MKMKKVLVLTTSPTIDGNGDALMNEAENVLNEHHVEFQRIDTRNLNINPCKGCYGCAKTGVCVQQDDFKQILDYAHECDGILVETPIYYNCMAAQMLLLINRLCCTFACKDYRLGPKKKIGLFLTCTGSDIDEMKHHVDLILNLPSIQRSVLEYKTEVFTACNTKDTCKNTELYLKRVSKIAQWICE